MGKLGVRQSSFVYVPFGLEEYCFYFRAHCIVKDELSIALRFVEGIRHQVENTKGRKCDGEAEESESRAASNFRK